MPKIENNTTGKSEVTSPVLGEFAEVVCSVEASESDAENTIKTSLYSVDIHDEKNSGT